MRFGSGIAVLALIAGTAGAQEGRLPIEPPLSLAASHDLGDGLVAHEIWRDGAPVCGRNAEGAPLAGFVVAGSWNARMDWHPGGATLACPGGAAAKCILAGFRPWQGEAARDQHLACVRMVRADYCGDGVAHTEPGVRIGITSGTGPAPRDVESGWRPDGATRMVRSRLAGGLDYVRRTCPDRLDPDGPPPLLWNE